VSRRFCRLPQGFSQAIAQDCERRHKHMSSREVRELQQSGEIEFFDLHPITLLPRFVDRVHGTQRTHLPAPIIQRGSGTHGSYEQAWAQEKIEDHGAEMRAFSRLYSETRWVALSRVIWNPEGIFVNCDPAPKGSVVLVGLKPPTPEARYAASEYWRISGVWQKRIAADPGQSEGLLRQNITRAMTMSALRDSKAALRQLDAAWPEIVGGYRAGPYSEELSRAHARDLPSMILGKTLAAYLFPHGPQS